MLAEIKGNDPAERAAHRALLQADQARTAAPHAFYNICLHRGSRLLYNAAGCRPGPYHATEGCVHAFDRWYAQRLATALS
jgi:phenylpropionate dioxygenase-like ring-hydroxylating dioxygenase large terminal subunit